MRDGRGDTGAEWLGLDLAPGTWVAGFRLEGPLATGSFGALYQARRGERRYAIKLVPKDPRGEREVDALRRVRDLPVVGFHGYGMWPDEEPRFLVLALELVDGQELEAWARDFNPDARELLVRVLRPLVDMLGQVHAAGVVHRDVKESNIVMRQRDGQPVLVDFGAAGFEGAPRLTQRLPPGTPEYRSPELLRFAREWEGEPPPGRPGDDLWALGVTLYALLTRALPFGDRHGPLTRAILDAAPEPPHVRNPRVPRALSELCLRLLEKDPEARYADAPALARALEEELARADATWSVRLFPGERRALAPPPPVMPPPVVSPPVVSPPARPRLGRIALALSGVLVLLLGLGAVLTMRGPPREVVPRAPPETSAAPATTRQANSRHELAPGDMTGEVGFNAGLPKSPIPAPVATATLPVKESMRPSKNRLLLSVATAACLTSGCASMPKPAGPPGEPPSAPCPPGSEETHRRHGLYILHPNGRSETLASFQVVLAPIKEGAPRWDVDEMQFMESALPVRNGPVVARMLYAVYGLEGETMFEGRILVREDYVFGRFTRMRTPDGKESPVCMDFNQEIDKRPGVTNENRVIRPAIVDLDVRTRFAGM